MSTYRLSPPKHITKFLGLGFNPTNLTCNVRTLETIMTISVISRGNVGLKPHPTHNDDVGVCN